MDYPRFELVPTATKSTATGSVEKSLPFEDAMKKLEDIVESMESGELPLETLLARFEEGTRLVKTCQARLEEADLKISKLEKNRAGEFSLQPVTEVEEP